MNESDEKEEKKKRRDSGQIRLTGRDFEALTWIEDMRAIHEEDLGWLLGRLGGKPEGIGAKRVYETVKRWESAGLAISKRNPFGGAGRPRKGSMRQGPGSLTGGRYVEVTQKGCDYVGVERPDGKTERVSPVALSRLRHTLMCSRVRLAYEAQGYEWFSERRILREGFPMVMDDGTLQHKAWTRHRPDGVIAVEGAPARGVEVELATKEPLRLQRIIADLMSDARLPGGADYWCDGAAIASAVAGQVAAVTGGAMGPVGTRWWGTVDVYDLAEIGSYVPIAAGRPGYLPVAKAKELE